MAISSFLLLLFALALFTLPLAPAHVHPLLRATQQDGFRTELRRRDSNLPISKRFQNSFLRARYLASKAGEGKGEAIPGIPMTDVGSAYTMPLLLGTPPQRMDVLFDTGSDLVWVQCLPSAANRFNYTQSSTFHTVSCSDACSHFNDYCLYSCEYQYQYGGGGATSGLVVTETVSLRTSNTTSSKFSDILVGCSLSSSGFPNLDGVAGFGRGQVSLITQLSDSIGNKFSYCLSPLDHPSPFFYGSAAPVHASNAQSTPLLTHDGDETFYFVNLTSVSADGYTISMPHSDLDSSVGTIFDSGTTLTFLPLGVYIQVISVFSRRINLPLVNGTSVGLDLCYNISLQRDYTFPSLALHFPDAWMNLHQDNYIVVPSRADAEAWNESVACLAIMSSASIGINIIGNVMQQGYHIMFDNEKSTVTFAPASCSEL
ncbi:aspartic proteinase CDR1 [Selaginella moellendorffii]|nr:aspartic proteinase CDR1 [Selaginella moellendorffii]|eukprot:XP_002962296.2 aspartic proteinase CDR1 [Selaginella moellendorffii]